jgi:hypothetical protein
VFGSTAYVLVAPEKWKKLDNWVVKGRVVGHLEESKGWTFWIPTTKKFTSSAWADFGHDCLPSPRTPADVKNMTLGDFMEEEIVSKQERNVDRANKSKFPGTDTVLSTFKQAMKSLEAAHWKKAIHNELENLRQKSVWQVKQLPQRQKALGARWVFAKIPAAGGSIRYKACYVAKGFNQKEGMDYAHTLAPTATFTSMCILLAVATKHQWLVYNFVFVAAYLNAPIDKEFWVRPPKGLHTAEGKACILDKALYSTKQAACYWWKHLSSTLASLGYTSSYYDTSVYTLSNKTNRSIIWVHVDDGIVTGWSDTALRLLEKQLKGLLKSSGMKG